MKYFLIQLKMFTADIYFNAFHKGNFVQRFWHRQKFKRVMNSIKSKNAKILDAGCGSGVLFSLMPDSEFCVGFDMSKEQIKFAKRYSGRGFVIGDLKNMPFKENTFDFITIIEVLEHLNKEDAIKTLNRLNKLLRKGGSLILTTPNYISLWPIIEIIWNKINPINYAKLHVNKMATKNVRQFLEQSDFNNIKIETFFIISPFLAFLPFKIAEKIGQIETKIFPDFGSLIFAKANKNT